MKQLFTAALVMVCTITYAQDLIGKPKSEIRIFFKDAYKFYPEKTIMAQHVPGHFANYIALERIETDFNDIADTVRYGYYIDEKTDLIIGYIRVVPRTPYWEAKIIAMLAAESAVKTGPFETFFVGGTRIYREYLLGKDRVLHLQAVFEDTVELIFVPTSL